MPFLAFGDEHDYIPEIPPYDLRIITGRYTTAQYTRSVSLLRN
jgi:hypothetical protein